MVLLFLLTSPWCWANHTLLMHRYLLIPGYSSSSSLFLPGIACRGAEKWNDFPAPWIVVEMSAKIAHRRKRTKQRGAITSLICYLWKSGKTKQDYEIDRFLNHLREGKQRLLGRPPTQRPAVYGSSVACIQYTQLMHKHSRSVRSWKQTYFRPIYF